MTRVTKDGDTFCIDTTEVTADEYAAFVATKPDVSLFPDACAQRGPVGPTSASGASPVQVDWCVAAAYCAWAGKTLCGRTSGGPLQGSGGGGGGGGPANKSAWVAACGAGVFAPGAAIADWEDACTGNEIDDVCTARGAACDAATSLDRTGADAAGIRCCAP
jgi:hypothetical protein